jgi:hypothetical protein
MEGWRAGHLNATSTVGVPSLAEASVTIQCEWGVVDGMTKPGVPPVAHSGVAPSAEMQIFVVSVGEVVTICADTAPGPSLSNWKVRATAVVSVVESSIRPVNVIVAVGAVWDGSGTTEGSTVGVAVGAEVGTAVAGAADVAGATEGEGFAGVALGPDGVAAAIGPDDADAVSRAEPGPAA